MSLKILCFGDKHFLERTIAALRPQIKPPSDDQILLDTFDIDAKTFLTFSITNPQLIPSQSAGTNALLFFLSTEVSIYQQKDFLFGVFTERPEFQGLPVVIAYDKEKDLSIKDIVNHFELFKVKDRASMIKEIDGEEIQTSKEVFRWINSQVEFQRTRTFDAQPKVVKMKPKYRDSEPESTQKKYEEIVKEKNLRGATVKEQEQAYIGKEKDRIKNENMEKQLNNFNKNKKKMAPYDIKATPNPRIEANLHFFLKDPKVDKGPEVNIKIQTDEFRERPPEKEYVPKKTGINIATQIEAAQLFDFDKEVQPILDILTTRALETATLQIEEQEQILKIAKYKNAFNDRVKKQKKHEDEKIQAEKEIIREKNRLLEATRKKDEAKRNINRKVITYACTNNFLKDIYGNATLKLYQENYFPNTIENQLKTNYLDEILALSVNSYNKLIEKKSCTNGVFEESCLKEISERATEPKNRMKELKKLKKGRRVNKGKQQRFIHIKYDHTAGHKFSSFSKYLDKELAEQLDDYVTKRQEEIQEIEEKHQAEEVDEAEVQRVKEKDNDEFSKEHKTYFINGDKNINFTLTSNKFQKPSSPDILVGGVLSFDKEFQLADTVFSNKPSQSKYIDVVNDLRYFKDPINMDDGMIIKFASVPDQIRAFIIFCKFTDVGSFAAEPNIKKVKNSSYGLEFYERAIPLGKEDIGEKIKWQEYGKPAENEEVKETKENVYVVGYHLVRKTSQIWILEEVKYTSKATAETDEEFIEKLSAFFRKSQDIFKVEEEEPKQKTPSRNKRRSKKNLVEEKEVPKKQQIKISSKVLKEVRLNLSDKFQQNFNKLRDEVVDWKEFIENSPDGWELEFKGKKIESNEQLLKYRKVGDIVLVKIPPPKIEEKEEEAEGEKDQNENDDN